MKLYSVAGTNKDGNVVFVTDIRAKSINNALDVSGLVLTCDDLFVYRNDKVVAGPFFPKAE